MKLEFWNLKYGTFEAEIIQINNPSRSCQTHSLTSDRDIFRAGRCPCSRKNTPASEIERPSVYQSPVFTSKQWLQLPPHVSDWWGCCSCDGFWCICLLQSASSAPSGETNKSTYQTPWLQQNEKMLWWFKKLWPSLKSNIWWKMPGAQPEIYSQLWKEQKREAGD